MDAFLQNICKIYIKAFKFLATKTSISYKVY